jgi:Uma2 family endonuclease
MATTTRSLIDELYAVEGKAEIVGGRLQIMEGTGDMPSRTGGAIYASLRAHERQTHSGIAYPDNAVFLVDLPNRQSFSPDAAYFAGPRTGMKFLNGAPVFAAEVRSEGDYGRTAEREMAQKRADYFAAGTLVVWDVDLLAEDVVRVYRAADPSHPTVFRRGQLADAEPAVPGWRMPVDELFE